MQELGFPVRRVREGLAEIIVPDFDAYRRPDGVFEPAWAPVFYNPRAAFNRDVAVVYARSVGASRVAEPLAGSGVRAVRYALEANAEVWACDADPDAVRLARLNAEVNGVADRVRVEWSDANLNLYKLRWERIILDLVDLDPFGSPAPFLEAALAALRGRGKLAATATDTAPLCGAHPKALRRRYDVIPARTFWDKEQAARILAGYFIRRAASREYAFTVELDYYADYYIRIYGSLQPGAGRADEALSKVGYALFCPTCGYSEYTSEPRSSAKCPICSTQLKLVGPLYTGELCRGELVSRMLEEAKKMKWLSNYNRVLKLLEQLREECCIAQPYVRLDKLCSYLHMSMPSPRKVVEELKSIGYRAARTHFDPRGVKTDAPYSELIRVVKGLREHT